MFIFFSKLDSSLFAADSFEDLSSEVFEKKIDGECSSRTQSFSSTGKKFIEERRLLIILSLLNHEFSR